MRCKFILVVLVIIGFTTSCSEDIGVNSFTYQCESDKQCGEGYVCDKTRGCIKRESPDGGRDTGNDIGRDIVIDEDIGDVLDYKDVEDVGDIVEIHDAEDVVDVVDEDVVSDIEDVEDVFDISDGGVDVQISYELKMESVYDFSAGVCESDNYTLKYVSGFTASEQMENSQYTLHRNVLFKK